MAKKETVEDRLNDASRRTLNAQTIQCAGVENPDLSFMKDVVWVTPPHLAEGLYFMTAGSSSNDGHGVRTQCDDCRILFSKGPEAVLAAYDPNDTRVPRFLPEKVFVPPPPPLDIPWGDGSEPVPARIQKED